MSAWQSSSHYAPDVRSETLIASCRAVLALSFFFSTTMDPSEPQQHGEIVHNILGVYALYSLLAATMLWRSLALLSRVRLAMHVFDLVVFATVTFFTRAPPNVLFAFLVFLVVSASLRWHGRGGAWATGTATVVFVGIGLSRLADTPIDLDRFIVGSGALVVVASMVGYLAGSRHRRRGEAEKLAAWPSAAGRPVSDVLRDALRHAADVVEAPRAVVIWDEPDEPARLAWWAHGEFGADREEPGRWSSVVAAPLAGSDFLCRDVTRDGPEVLYVDGTVFTRWRGRPCDTAFAERFAIRSVLSVRMGDGGRLFFFDQRHLTSDELHLGRIVAHQMMSSLEQAVLLQSSKLMAATDERMRLARDLHDGVLQALAALALQLEAAARSLDHTTRERLAWIAERLGDEQRRLRLLTSGQRSPTSLGEDPHGRGSALRQLVDRLARDWSIAVTLSLEGAPGIDRLPGPLAEDVSFIVHETVSNAARHGGASAVHVDVAITDKLLTLKVTDDGRGFPFRGRYDDEELSANGIGPLSLQRRVRESRGRLTIDSQPSGARLDIDLPMETVDR